MNKLKDIIYDKNDIFIALIIVIIAGLIIHNRIEIIMAYPSELIAETTAKESAVVSEESGSRLLKNPMRKMKLQMKKSLLMKRKNNPQRRKKRMNLKIIPVVTGDYH